MEAAEVARLATIAIIRKVPSSSAPSIIACQHFKAAKSQIELEEAHLAKRIVEIQSRRLESGSILHSNMPQSERSASQSAALNLVRRALLEDS